MQYAKYGVLASTGESIPSQPKLKLAYTTKLQTLTTCDNLSRERNTPPCLKPSRKRSSP
jgi:hypothetical protein